MKNNNILGAFAALVFVSVLSFGAFAPAAHAQFDGGDFGGDFSGGCCGGGSDVVSGYGNYSPSYGSDVVDGYANYSPSYGSDVVDGYSTYQPTSYDSYSGDYGSTGYGTSGYSTGGYSTGGYSTGGGYMTGGGYGYSTPVYTQPSTPSNTTVTTNNNTCTGNSCNSDDHSVVNITNPAPVINNNNVVANYAQPVATQQQYCANGYYGTYPNCYRNNTPVVYQQPPVAYNTAAPYISLSQAPYTGLELGFWGSIAYWGFMIAFALFAAYLIAIKRVQNNIAAYMKSVLFGTDEEEVEVVTTDTETPAAPAPQVVAAVQGDMIDSFIMSQVNRARHA